jgi:hypothetical protein
MGKYDTTKAFQKILTEENMSFLSLLNDGNRTSRLASWLLQRSGKK